jgi:cysteine desulfurase / selenocysteine lyase
MLKTPSDQLQRCRQDFPILKQKIHGKPLVYLDNAATTQRPTVVTDAMKAFVESDYANTHGRIHALSERAQTHFDEGRETVARFIGAEYTDEVVFVSGATHGLNLVAQGFFGPHLKSGDRVLVTVMEHHSNFVPWQQLCQRVGAECVVIDIDDAGQLDLEQLSVELARNPVCLVMAHVSNVLGQINPVKTCVELAHQHGVKVVVDGAQAAGRIPINVSDLGCDFYVFSGHKMYGPSGMGVVYGRRAHWSNMQPWFLGGGAVATVSAEQVTFLAPPACFEAGTQHVEGVVGLTAAIRYIESIGLSVIAAHERALGQYIWQALSGYQGCRVLGGIPDCGLISFVLEGMHPHDVVMLLDQLGIAIRGGHHCAQPLMKRFGVMASSRVSCAVYNTRDEVDVFLNALGQVQEVLGAQ